MRKWVLKAVVQKAISYLPASQKINQFFQKHVTKGLALTDQLFEDKLNHFHHHWRAFCEHSISDHSAFRAFELGTGWYPIVPIMLFIHGAEKVFTWDVQSLLQGNHLQSTIGKFLAYHDQGRLQIPDNSRKVLQDCYKELDRSSIEQVLSQMHIVPMVGDARQTGIYDNSIDISFSNNTFEHIDALMLRQILLEMKRFAKPDGVMSHFIDLTDHFSHLDKEISSLHFLKYSPAQWRLIDNAIQPQNRLRITDYRSLYKEVDIPINKEQNFYVTEEDFAMAHLHDQFKTIPEEDLMVSHSYLVSRM